MARIHQQRRNGVTPLLPQTEHYTEVEKLQQEADRECQQTDMKESTSAVEEQFTAKGDEDKKQEDEKEDQIPIK